MPKQTPEPEWKRRLDQCEEILGKIDELPERAEDFAASVQEKVEDIARWIEDSEKVTEAQCVALDNIQAGVEAWLQ